MSDVTTRTRPGIAAVIVNYNYARFLPDAVMSVLTQEVPFHEVVVVNDGSTDDSMAVLDRFRGSVNVLDIANGGQLGACLAGLAATTAEYVYFLDADDFAHPDLVGTVGARLSGSPVKVQFQLEAVSPTVHRLESVFPSFPRHYDAARMRADNRSIGFYICPPTSGNVFRRDALLALPLDSSDRRDFIDGPPALVMPYLGEIESIDVALASYRVHGDNHSQWSEPTAALLAHELEWFDRRWAETSRLLDGAVSSPPARNLYRAERELMVAALQNQARTIGLAAAYLRALAPTHLPARQKVMLSGWAAALALPHARARTALVRARRSPLNRSSGMRTLLRMALRGRRRSATNVSAPSRDQP